MKRFSIALLLVFLSFHSFSQTIEQKDSLAKELCNHLQETRSLADTTRLHLMYMDHFVAFISKYPEDEQDAVVNAVMSRLLRNCEEFMLLMNRLSPENEYWKTVTKRPADKLAKKTCRAITTHKTTLYHETNGDKVYFTIKDGVWKESFPDGSFSVLRFAWVSDCEFDLEFVSSTNLDRKNYSKPGDKYRYLIYGNTELYYEVSAEISGTKVFDLFKVYVE